MKRKLLNIILATVFAISLIGCGNNQTNVVNEVADGNTVSLESENVQIGEEGSSVAEETSDDKVEIYTETGEP